MDDIKKLRELRAGGCCCAQVMVSMGLEALGEENERLVAAAAGLCGGMKSGLLCGALSGAACMLSMFDGENAAAMIGELREWFEEEYGNVNCIELLDGDPSNRTRVCPQLIENTYLKAKEILGTYGYVLDEMFKA